MKLLVLTYKVKKLLHRRWRPIQIGIDEVGRNVIGMIVEITAWKVEADLHKNSLIDESHEDF